MLSLRYFAPPPGAADTYDNPGGASTPFADLVASLGAISYWGLQGNANDSISGHNLTLTGSPSYGTGPGGELTQALSLVAASNQWGSVNHAALRPTEAWSVVAWFNATTLALDLGLVGCADTNYQGYCLRADSSDGLGVEVNNGTTTQVVIGSGTVISTGVWYMAAATYDKVNLGLYFNGTPDSNSPAAATFSIGYGSNTLYIGNWDGNAGRDWNGLVAGVAIFGTALSSANISSLYAAV